MTRTVRTMLAAVAAVLVFAPALAWAHAHLVKSEPAENARLTTSPAWIQLWFSEPVLLEKTTIRLKDSAGVVMPTASITRGKGARSVRVAVQKALKPGRYTVEWKNQALNGHPESGSYNFSVASRKNLDRF